MKQIIITAAVGFLVAASAPAWAQSNVVTIYSADGLHDGTPSWFGEQFSAFTKETGIKVQYVEAGSSGVVDRIQKELSNGQADVLVTVPPFMQKAAADGLLAPYSPAAASNIAPIGKDSQSRYTAIVYNYPNFIYNAALLKTPPSSYDDLLSSKYEKKIQYSTPGQAGDGTAVMLQVIHAFGSKKAGLDYLGKLEKNNLGPSASTGKLTALVNKGELYVANGDLQMNLIQMHDNPNIQVFFPTGPDGKKATFGLPYYVGLVAHAPHSENGKKLIDFLLSKTAQESVSSVAQGLPVRTDVHPNDDSYKRMQAAMNGVDIWEPDWTQVLANLKSDIADYKQAIGNK